MIVQINGEEITATTEMSEAIKKIVQERVTSMVDFLVDEFVAQAIVRLREGSGYISPDDLRYKSKKVLAEMRGNVLPEENDQ